MTFWGMGFQQRARHSVFFGHLRGSSNSGAVPRFFYGISGNVYTLQDHSKLAFVVPKCLAGAVIL
jgi:hypothetical protein